MEIRYGPKMRALNDRQRAFVEHFVTTGQRNAAASCEAAGYECSTKNSLYVSAHRLVHDEKIGAAIKEFMGNRFNALGPMALQSLAEIAADRTHRDCASSARFICEILGFSPTKKVEVDQTVTVSLQDLRRRAIELLADPLLVDQTADLIDVTPTIGSEETP